MSIDVRALDQRAVIARAIRRAGRAALPTLPALLATMILTAAFAREPPEPDARAPADPHRPPLETGFARVVPPAADAHLPETDLPTHGRAPGSANQSLRGPRGVIDIPAKTPAAPQTADTAAPSPPLSVAPGARAAPAPDPANAPDHDNR